MGRKIKIECSSEIYSKGYTDHLCCWERTWCWKI